MPQGVGFQSGLHQMQSYIALGFPRICITSLSFAKIPLCSTSTFWWALDNKDFSEKTGRNLLHVPELRLRWIEITCLWQNDSLLGQTLLWGSLTAFNASSSRECFSEESLRASMKLFEPHVVTSRSACDLEDMSGKNCH